MKSRGRTTIWKKQVNAHFRLIAGTFEGVVGNWEFQSASSIGLPLREEKQSMYTKEKER